MRIFVWILRIFIFCGLLVLALDNGQIVMLKFTKYYQWNMPLIVVGLGFFVVGLVLGLFAVLPSLIRARFANNRLRKQLHKTQQSIHHVREMSTSTPIPPIA